MKEDRPLGLRSGAEFAAAVRELVNKCRESTSPKELLESCESLFRLLRDKKIELEVPYIPSDLLQQQQQQESKPGFTQWLQQSFHVFVSIVFELLESSEAPLQKLGLSYLFRILKHESEVHKSSTFPLAAFQVFASRLLQANAFPGYLQDLLLKEYLHKYLDVRYYMLVVILKILREFVAEKNQQHNAAAAAAAEGGQHEAAGNEWFRWKRGERDLSSRLTSLLLQISDIIAAGPRGRRRRGPPGDPPGGPPGGPGGPPGAPKDSDSEASESEDEKKWMEEEEAAAAATWIKGLAAAKAVEPGSHRLVFQNAWLLLLLQVQHSKALLQQLLAAVPRRVLPLLSNPLLLSDFFLKAFAESSHLSLRISALSGLFYLLTKHRLGNPELLSAAAAAAAAADQEAAAGAHLYQQLYRLLTPAALSPRLRGRFLRLLNLALRSDLLPACLVAAFIKKCCRVACVAAPAAALCLQAFAASLLQKYSTICKPLLLLPPHVAASLRVSGDSFDYSKCEVRRARGAPRGPSGVVGGRGRGPGGGRR
ncbi:hypothetical protein, conserved [Eimeria tenella]|uniref:CCAAT-binding factor domain-containing protein n=1 Tax=Eimeria tenella TaxID=5802 RepID=U6KLW9_EIMTE|nr:hypothetical protein, conserved [Eimeria tenella]CDJ38966.1 hypothetical protein, conserved [Eimeria tenella]|eukprot:XP_013229721.1 hypothetical protein, conserved [Eimeria tenella]